MNNMLRKAEAFPTEDQNGILALVNRHKYKNLWPCNLPTLDSFGKFIIMI